jgi:hypothetical protein
MHIMLILKIVFHEALDSDREKMTQPWITGKKESVVKGSTERRAGRVARETRNKCHFLCSQVF